MSHAIMRTGINDCCVNTIHDHDPIDPEEQDESNDFEEGMELICEECGIIVTLNPYKIRNGPNPTELVWMKI